MDFGEEGTVTNVTGNVPVFPLEKLESYRKGNPINPVETPRIQIASELDMELDDTLPEREQEQRTETSTEESIKDKNKEVKGSILDDL